MSRVSPFILCGGAGTRLWPLSREAFPKQFHNIVGEETLFQQTCRRLIAEAYGPLCVLANQQHRFIIADQLQQIDAPSSTIALEPVGRNTGPAACVAALMAGKAGSDSLVLLAPSDHVITDAGKFAKAVAIGADTAREGALVTFGVEPDSPHTGYGYIEVDKMGGAALKVRRFVEKPSLQDAKRYVDSGRFYWNAGIFLFSAGTMLKLMEMHAPEILTVCRQALADAVEDLDFLRLGEIYAKAPSISLDYAIGEKAENIHCVPLGTAWSDLGSWPAVWNQMIKNEAGNVVQGEEKDQVLLAKTANSYVYSDHGCVTVIGLENVIVVTTDDAVLVASKSDAESVKEIVEQAKSDGKSYAVHHNRVYRPWGWYQMLNRGDRYQVKRIMVKPGGVLSLQSHHHRSEHWVVVSGSLHVTKDDRTEILCENESTYIPIGSRHRIANFGEVPAYLIEIQSGSYLGEDDIVRFEDVYGRKTPE